MCRKPDGEEDGEGEEQHGAEECPVLVLHLIDEMAGEGLRQECQHIIYNKEGDNVEGAGRPYHEIQAARTQPVNKEMQQRTTTDQLIH